MENLKIEKTRYTLEVELNKDTGILEMTGSSYPENALDFFTPIIEWIKNYISTIKNQVVLHLRVSYLNTSSTKCILDIFEILEQYHQAQGKVEVNWYYAEGDEDIKETGEELCEDIDLPFNFISY
jgi:hypothetical protein